jgi:hypothetical protein
MVTRSQVRSVPATSKVRKVKKKNEGSRSRSGAGRRDFDEVERDVHASNIKSDMERHITGRMYLHTPATHYHPDNILNRESFFFEQAKPESFTVMDCLVHATNGGFRCPIFVDRKQVFQLSLERQKKDRDFLAGLKMRSGYPPCLFDDFVVKGSKSYSIKMIAEVKEIALLGRIVPI